MVRLNYGTFVGNAVEKTVLEALNWALIFGGKVALTHPQAAAALKPTIRRQLLLFFLPESELVINVAALPPLLSRPTPNPPSNRRRVTISSVALNMANLPSADDSLVRTPTNTHNPHVHTGSSTPISPVAMGLMIQRDYSTAIEQVRAMLHVE